MPFKSKAQQRFICATNEALCKKFAAKTTNYKALPKKKSKILGKLADGN